MTLGVAWLDNLEYSRDCSVVDSHCFPVIHIPAAPIEYELSSRTADGIHANALEWALIECHGVSFILAQKWRD